MPSGVATTDDERPAGLRVTVVGNGGPDIAELLCPTAVHTPSLRDAVEVTTDVLVLYTSAPAEELAAFARLRASIPPVLVVVSNPAALSTVVRRLRRRRDDAPRAAPRTPALPSAPQLSPREVEIMRLVADGHTNAAVADRLGLAEKTVRNRVSQIYLKLGVRTRTEAIVRWQGRA